VVEGPGEDKLNNGGGLNQKERHFKYFEMLDTLPTAKKEAEGTQADEVLLEYAVDGAS
jgi:ankyrin repeat protein